jgi:4-aminobutyrate aminotransferase-like enzyme
MKSLEVLKSEKMAENAEAMGIILRNELEKLGLAVKDSKSGQNWDWIIN